MLSLSANLTTENPEYERKNASFFENRLSMDLTFPYGVRSDTFLPFCFQTEAPAEKLLPFCFQTEAHIRHKLNEHHSTKTLPRWRRQGVENPLAGAGGCRNEVIPPLKGVRGMSIS